MKLLTLIPGWIHPARVKYAGGVAGWWWVQQTTCKPQRELGALSLRGGRHGRVAKMRGRSREIARMCGHILTHRARLHALITSCEKPARSSGKQELAGCLTRISLIYSGRVAALPCQLRWHTLSYDA